MPLDLWKLVLTHLYDKKCPFCNRFFVYEICNKDCRAFTAVCKRWRAAYKRTIILELRNNNFRFCIRPRDCLIRYIEGRGKIPFLILVDDPRRGVRAQQAERGHPRVWGDELSSLDESGS